MRLYPLLASCSTAEAATDKALRSPGWIGSFTSDGRAEAMARQAIAAALITDN